MILIIITSFILITLWSTFLVMIQTASYYLAMRAIANWILLVCFTDMICSCLSVICKAVGHSVIIHTVQSNHIWIWVCWSVEDQHYISMNRRAKLEIELSHRRISIKIEFKSIELFIDTFSLQTDITLRRRITIFPFKSL